MADELLSKETWGEPIPLEVWGEISEEAVKDKDVVENLQSMNDLEPGGKDGFFYEIVGDNQVACVLVKAYAPKEPTIKWYGVAKSFEELRERHPEIVNDKDNSLLQINTSQAVAHKVFVGADPIQATMSNKVKVEGDWGFVIKNLIKIRDFMAGVGRHYQQNL